MKIVSIEDENRSRYNQLEHDVSKAAFIPNRTFNLRQQETFEMVLVGDTSFGENYQEQIKQAGGESILEKYGYAYSLTQVQAILDSANFTVMNLESPITDLQQSPYAGSKEYIHWTHVDHAPAALANANVSLVSIANNHSYDFGPAGFEQTLTQLNAYNIAMIGAGKNLADAAKPYIGEIQFAEKRFRFAIIAAYEFIERNRDRYQAYAEENKLGLLPLNCDVIRSIVNELKHADPDIFIILYPHWGGNYQLREDKQKFLATELLTAGIDLIIGHGAHMIQEFEKINERWAVYSIGNFVFNSKGSYQYYNAPPYSYVAKLLITPTEKNFDIKLKLYPIYSNNMITAYQPRPVNDDEFEDFCATLGKIQVNTETRGHAVARGRDSFGYFLELPVSQHSTPSEKIKSETKPVTKSELKPVTKSVTKPITKPAIKSELKIIGFVCGVLRAHKLEDYISSWMFRGMAMDATLNQHGYRVFCYSCTNVHPELKTADGYIFEDGEFKSVTLPIPAINYDCHTGMTKLRGKPGFKIKDYEPWVIQQGCEIYPSREFCIFTKDKLATHKLLMRYNDKISPMTEIFDNSIEQFQHFFNNNDLIFLKPRYGNQGDNIYVLNKDNNTITVAYYHNAEKKVIQCNNLPDVVKHIKSQSLEMEYIIQRGIKTLRVNESVFDIRVTALNDGANWHYLFETRVGAKGSALSNVSQGGYSLDAETALLSILPPERAKQLLQKITTIANDIAEMLMHQFRHRVNEFAFDFLVDEDESVYIAELNSKPGVAGDPSLFKNFLHMTDHEKMVYEKFTLKHGEYLAKFLLLKAQQYTPSTAIVWFDAISAPLTLDEATANKLITTTFQSLQAKLSQVNDSPLELERDTLPRIIFLTISDANHAAHTVMGTGLGIMRAINHGLTKALATLPATFPIAAIKMDIVQDATFVDHQNHNQPLKIERSLQGIAFTKDSAIALLAEQLVVGSYVDSTGEIHLNKLKNAGMISNAEHAEIKEKGWLAYYHFSTENWYHDAVHTYPLYRNHRLYSEITSEQLLVSANLAGNYLIHCVNDDGSFIYEYLPKKDLTTTRYNILRHAGTIYAMLELFEVTKDEALINKAKLALDNLISRMENVSNDHRTMLRVVEDGHCKLGANALAILALSKMIKITGDRSYLPTARKLANWICHTQNHLGEFTVHKQRVSTNKVTPFISDYYPGEAIFSLARLYQIDPNPEWLNCAVKAALFIIDIRDVQLTVSTIAHDHWFLYGLNELYRLHQDKKFIIHTIKICEAIIRRQTLKTTPKDIIGSFGQPPRSTPVAIRAEGLCAAYHLLQDTGYTKEANAIQQAIILCLRFQLQTQFQPESTLYLPNPQRAIGGFSKSLTDYSIRIDYVQHNLSAMLGLLKILTRQQQAESPVESSK